MVLSHLPGSAALTNRSAHFRVGVALAGVLLLLLGYLALAPTPWDVGLFSEEDGWHKVSVRRWALGGSWCAAAANAVVVALLLVTRRRWLGGTAPEMAALAPPARSPGRGQIAAVVLAMVVLGALSFTRLDLSFWDDEVRTVERAINGRYGDGPDGELQFKPASWTETFFYYRTPNNHVPFSIAARLSLGAWQSATGAERRDADETAVRVPAWLASLALVAGVAALLWQLGFAAAAPVAGAVLALHPWLLRYASEARGYTIVMGSVVAGVSLLLCVWQRGTWGRWAGFGGAQLLLLWTFPGALWHAVVASAVAAGGVFWLHPSGAARRIQLRRWLVTQIGMAGAGLQLGLPLVGPLLLYLAGETTHRSFGRRWLEDEAGYLFAGAPWRQPSGLGPDFVQLAPLATDHPVLFWGTALAAGLAVVAGAVRLTRLRDVRALLVPLLLLPAVLTWLQATVTNTYLFEWYLTFALPGLVLLAAIGWDACPRSGASRWVAGVGALVFLVAYAFVTEPARSRLRAGSLQPLREASRIARPDADPFAPGQDATLTACYSVPSGLYDPRVQLLRSASELRELMAEADESGKTLYVDHGWHLARQKDRGAFWQLLNQADVFEEVAVLPGWKPRLTRFVWRYRSRAGPDPAPAEAPLGGATAPRPPPER